MSEDPSYRQRAFELTGAHGANAVTALLKLIEQAVKSGDDDRVLCLDRLMRSIERDRPN